MSNDKKEEINYDEQVKVFVNEVNNFRQNPQSFIPHLEKLKTLFKESVLYREGELPIQTSEGIAAVDEAIEVLKTSHSLPAFQVDENLSKAAKLQVDDIGVKGLASHEGSNGSTVSDRIEQFCEWEGLCAENLDFGNRSGLNSLLSLIIDDGIINRGHRNNLLNENLLKIGVAAGPHKDYDTCFAITFVSNTRDKDKSFYDKATYKYQYPEDLKAKPEEKRIKNQYQLDDPDAPDDTVAIKTIKQTKLYDGKVHRVTKKFYTLKDGTTTIVEVEDF